MKIDISPAVEALSLTHEICYNTQEEQDSTYTLLDNSSHRSSESRGNCRFTRGFMNGYIIHTHPNTSKAYPSSEDILSTVRHSGVNISFIVTTIGVWELSYKDAFYIDSKQNRAIMKKINDSVSRPLYDAGIRRKLTKTVPKGINLDKLLDLIEEYKSNVISTLKKYNINNFVINFKHMSDIPDPSDYTVQASSVSPKSPLEKEKLYSPLLEKELKKTKKKKRSRKKQKRSRKKRKQKRSRRKLR